MLRSFCFLRVSTQTTTEEYEAYAAMVREHVNRVYINTSQVFGKRLDALAGRKNIDGRPGDSPTVLHLLSTWLEKSGGWDCKDVFCTPPARHNSLRSFAAPVLHRFLENRRHGGSCCQLMTQSMICVILQAKVTEFPDYIKMKERLDNGDFSEVSPARPPTPRVTHHTIIHNSDLTDFAHRRGRSTRWSRGTNVRTASRSSSWTGARRG